jgi:transcriptional regulator of acetoin/glycerol metabolism
MVSPLGGTGSFRVDLSVVCATNRRVRDAVSAGTFREDLYYRLNGLLLTLPGLREREDRVLLSQKILEDLAGTERAISIGADVIAIFERHPWPGNIRQMHNVLRTALALLGTGHEITVDELPEDFMEQAGCCNGDESGKIGNALLSDVEAKLISSTLDRTGGNIAAAARMMGIGRNTLYRKLRGQMVDN